ncbi:hypothetical protein Sru01_04760 [Sphaerisporangium rufum]|uniref:Lipoprotein n=1 Tax=Sphaerisporangium rufum TaxID=1381558 RepID=A0A919UX58_9ACTN|nr:hypothetical protein [Sphaerisporangium rufum]GII75494.1 hypothetical protein Sru01_04760 [Sphaerisporangium rufum]
MRMRAALAAVVVLGAGCSAAGAERPFRPADGPPPAGAGSTAGGTAGPSAAGAPLSAAGVRTVPVASGMSVDIEWPAGLDAERQAMVGAFTDGYVGSWKAVASGGTDTGYLSGVEDQAARDAYTWVSRFVNRRESATGTAKVYGIRVASVTGRGAEVDACVDETGVRVTEAGAAGRPVPSQPSWTRLPAGVYLQVAAVRRGDDGVWRVRAYLHAAYPSRRAKECRR